LTALEPVWGECHRQALEDLAIRSLARLVQRRTQVVDLDLERG